MAEIKARAQAPASSPLYSPEDGNHTAVSMSKFPSEDPITLGNNPSEESPLETGCTWFPGAYRPRASLLQKVGAELIATFILVFGGCGAVMVDVKSGGQVTHVGVALAFGLVITVMIYAVGHISGAHMNPAVTIAFATARHFPWKQVPAYLGAQITGAIASAYVLRLILNNDASEGASLPAGSNAQSLILEIIITFILMFVISAVATDTRAVGELAGIAVGGTIALNALMAGPISGASMNPARSLGPAIASSNYKSIWVYIVGPIVGAVAGALVYNLIRLPEQEAGKLQSKSSKSFRR
jgi:aquaporin NIP